MDKMDYKKAYKDLYLPKTKPMIIEVPKMNFIAVRGKGDPNIEGGEYQNSIPILYGISFTIKMSKMGTRAIDGYFDYVVPPLEGLWWMKDVHEVDYAHKENFNFCSIMRLPEYVDEEVYQWACDQLKKKKPDIDLSPASFVTMEEGLCVQIMHRGSYDEEPASVGLLYAYIEAQGYVPDYDGISATGQLRKHHEIYLSDPRKTKPENMKTVLRLPIRRK